MLYGFLKSAKPIHYLLSGIVLGLFMILITVINGYDVTQVITGFLLSLACLSVFQFIVVKNEIVARSALALWVLLWFLIACMVIAINLWALAALLLLLLGLRRMISLRTSSNYVAKIFDASFWIAIISLFNSWYALLFAVVYVSVFLFARNKMRFWFIPIIAILCIALLSFTLEYVFNIPIYKSWKNAWQLDVQVYKKGANAFMFYGIIMLSVIFLIKHIVSVIDFNKRVPPHLSILVTLMAVATTLMIINRNTTFGSILLTLPALAILLAKVSHTTKDKILREILLWLPVVVCAVNWALYL